MKKFMLTLTALMVAASAHDMLAGRTRKSGSGSLEGRVAMLEESNRRYHPDMEQSGLEAGYTAGSHDVYTGAGTTAGVGGSEMLGASEGRRGRTSGRRASRGMRTRRGSERGARSSGRTASGAGEETGTGVSY